MEELGVVEAAARLAAGGLRDCRVGPGALVIPDREAGDERPAPVLQGVTFAGTDLGALDLAGATLERCAFTGARLQRIVLSDARLQHCRFYDAAAGAGTSLRYARLEGAEFTHCDLSLCDLHGTQAWNLALHDCNAQGADFTRADFTRVLGRRHSVLAFTAVRCNLSFCQFEAVNLHGAVLAGSRLREALLDDVDLGEADLREADLSAVSARRLVLAGADLRGARIDGLDPRRIDLTGARIQDWQAPALLAAMGIVVEG